MTVVVGYRVADWDTPLWVSPNRSPSRYSFAGGVVQYWSLHPFTPWAEYFRGLNVRAADEASQIVLRPWAAELTLPLGTVDLSFDTATDLGVEPDALVDDDWTRCQAWVAEQHPPSLIVPSAALPGTSNIILFGPRVRSRYGVVPLNAEVDVPCDPVADRAGVLNDLLRCVRWRGTPHAGLQAWLTGADKPSPPSVRASML